MNNGTLARAGERWQLRYKRDLAHDAARVWRALTDGQELRAWFPTAIEGPFEPGAQLRFHNGDQPAMPDGSGEVVRCEPPSLLEFTWYGDVLRFEVEPRGERACCLTLTVTFDEQGKAARDGAGWHECLDLLAAVLDGTQTWQLGAHWREIHASYVDALGPEGATVGVPEEWSEPA